MNPLSLAWRNLWRTRRRSGVTIAAMIFGLWSMILTSGLHTGLINGMERNIVDVEMGEVQLFAPGYRKDPSLFTRIEAPAPLLQSLDQAGFPASPRILGSGLGAMGKHSSGVVLKGVDVGRDREVSSVWKRLDQGAWLEAGDPTGVVLGTQLAKNLEASVGAELVLLSQAADGSMANDLYTVRGILGTVSGEVDQAGVYMTLEALREFLALPEGVHQIVVRRPKELPLAEAKEQVLALAPQLDVQTWRELIPSMAQILESERVGIWFLVGIIDTSIAIVILNAMLMSVFERTREIGVLKALGVSPWEVMLLINLESLLMTALASAIGLALSLGPSLYLRDVGLDMRDFGTMEMSGIVIDPIWRSELTLTTFLLPTAMLFIFVGLASFFPSIRAALIRPIEAMRSS